MTNTMRLIKLNTNLLSMISLIVLLTIIFPTVTLIAMHDCDEARERVEAARRAVDKEVSDLNIARILWYAALVTGNPYLIQVARDNLNRAIEQLEKARNNLTLALSDYYRVYLINRNLIKLSFNLI